MTVKSPIIKTYLLKPNKGNRKVIVFKKKSYYLYSFFVDLKDYFEISHNLTKYKSFGFNRFKKDYEIFEEIDSELTEELAKELFPEYFV